MKPIRVVLIDDHKLLRSGVRALLEREADIEIVGEASDGYEGVQCVCAEKPDVVLLDLNMPGMSGLTALQAIVEDAPETHVLMLTVSEDADDLTTALRAGANGYLLKNIDADFLVNAVRKAAQDEAVMSPQMTAKLMRSVRQGKPPATNDLEKLSPREREILGLLARAASNKEIARCLNLAESTVKIHVQAILRKLKMSSRVQAAVYAVEHGVAPLGQSDSMA